MHSLAQSQNADQDTYYCLADAISTMQARRNAGLVPSIAGPFLLAANSLGNKLTDIAFDLAPSNVERGTVRFVLPGKRRHPATQYVTQGSLHM